MSGPGLHLPDAATAIRMLCGLFFIPHTIAKLSHMGPASEIFEKIGFRPARAFLLLTVGLETLAAIGLVFGVYPRLAGLIAAGILVVAAYAIARTRGVHWRWQHPGLEYMIFWAAVCLASTFL